VVVWWTYWCWVRGALSQVTSGIGPPSLVSFCSPASESCTLPLGVEMLFSLTSLPSNKRFEIWGRRQLKDGRTIKWWKALECPHGRTLPKLTRWFLLPLPVFGGRGPSDRRPSRRWTWADRSGSCSSRWRPPPGRSPRRSPWRCRPRCRWSGGSVGLEDGEERVKGTEPNGRQTSSMWRAARLREWIRHNVKERLISTCVTAPSS